MYRELLATLAEDFHLVAPDYPGFGYSDAPAPTQFTYTFDPGRRDAAVRRPPGA
jgi:pimeloyl-ACP methyl ester carboxylesterase